LDNQSTKAGSVLIDKDTMAKELERDEEEVIFGMNNGFFFYTSKLKNKGAGVYGRAPDEDFLSDLRNVNQLTKYIPGNHIDPHLQSQSNNFDFIENLMDQMDIPDTF
jgi:hypothetical protein